MFNLIAKIFGTKHDKDIKLIKPIVEEINNYYSQISDFDEEQLKAKTEEFRTIIKDRTAEIETEKEELSHRLKSEALSSADTNKVTERITQINKELFQIISETLDEILPEAFACVKQACHILTENRYSYDYAGQKGIWEMIPYDVQLIGGIVLHQGKIAEMATGEGKTLVAILPMYLNSLAGRGVHLVTVNDYLAKRDSEWMKPIFDILGVSIGAIQSNMEPDERKVIYDMDVTYGTNNEFGFDYLRDNMVTETESLVQREHFYSIVDEVDSVLIDEARTPLIISGPVGQSDQKFDEMNPRVKRLVEAQTKMVNQLVSEADTLLKSGNKEDKEKAGFKILSSNRALPKHKRFAKLMQDPENQKLLKETELFYLRDQGRKMTEIDETLYYTIDEKNHNIDISEKGRNLLSSGMEDKDMFVIPDIAAQLSALEVDDSLDQNEKQIRKDELYLVYAERSDRIHTVSQLLRAYSLYEKDVEYVIQDDKVMIVDEFTGRILDGRRYSEGLHQAIEAKEMVKVERDTQTLATVTLQNYFKLYKKLAGMTGTAETEAGEFDKIYALDVVVIPTNQDMIRNDDDDLIFRTKREKYNAIVNQVKTLLKEGRAVLVGTASVEVSEVISTMLRRQGVPHNVLNAKQNQKEAEIIANAGKKGAITIATNMAGRGTDIKLDHEVRKNGGLAIIGSERHEARRIDRQLRGRAGRQGDPGSSQFFISLEDDLMRLFGGDRMGSVMQRMKVPEGEPIQHSMITKSVERAQKKVEENNFGIRKRLLDYDNVMNQQREVIYTRRKQALRGDRLKGELFDFIEELSIGWFNKYHEEHDLAGLKRELISNLLCEINLTEKEFEHIKEEDCTNLILKAAEEFYLRKEQMLGSEFMSNLERIAVLQTIDDKWREHLRVMDDLKEGIHLRAYGQKDPILEYKGEAYKLFLDLITDINKESVAFAFKYFPRMPESELRSRRPSRGIEKTEGLPRMRKNSTAGSNLNFEHSSNIPEYLMQGPQRQQQEDEAPKVRTFKRAEEKISRNDMCPCGSGKKYKNCHGKIEQ